MIITFYIFILLSYPIMFYSVLITKRVVIVHCSRVNSPLSTLPNSFQNQTPFSFFVFCFSESVSTFPLRLIN